VRIGEFRLGIEVHCVLVFVALFEFRLRVDLVEQAFGAVGLEVAADLLELLAAVAHHPTGLGNVAQVGGQLGAHDIGSSVCEPVR
jgi:hypothetical protein